MDAWTIIYITVVGQALLAGLASIIWTLPKVEPHWKGAYWMGLGAVVAFIAAFVLLVVRRATPWAVSAQAVVYSLEFAIFVVSLLFVLVPYLHRLEARKKNGADQ